ncbi:MAG: polysaccharide deacetylase family protein, partial [Verrucomicrobiota bacterium]
MNRNHWTLRALKVGIALGFRAGRMVSGALLRKRILPSNVILNYHNVLPEEQIQFSKQMARLLELGLPRSVDAILEGQPGVLVTFDDAFAALAEYTLPLLKSKGIPAVIFAPSGNLGLAPAWKMESKNPNRHQRVMNPRELKQASDAGFEIGSHTRTHPHLPELDDSEGCSELEESKFDLEKCTWRHVRLLAFPYGEYDSRVLRWVRRAGYHYAFSALPERPIGFLRGRIDVTPSDWPLEFDLKVTG